MINLSDVPAEVGHGELLVAMGAGLLGLLVRLTDMP